MALIYIVEDDKNIQEIEMFALKNIDYAVEGFECAGDFYKRLYEKLPDLVLLDVMLPDEDGLEILKKIRSIPDTRKVPIMMITAKTTELDKVKGLDLGADDYITKPFNPVEVQARVKSQLRRYMQLGGGNMTKKNLAIGGIELDDSAKVVTLDGDAVSLTPTEYDILKLFMEQPGVVFSPKDIYRKVWKDAPFGSESTVAVHIRHLREKLEYDPANPRYLKVVWGQGYKMERGNTP